MCGCECVWVGAGGVSTYVQQCTVQCYHLKLYTTVYVLHVCIHRVLNTDNMSIVGLTIDYGPYGFMDRYDPGHICNGSGLPNTCTVYISVYKFYTKHV